MVECRVEITLVPLFPKVIYFKKSSRGTDEEEGASQQMFLLRFMYDNYLFINHINLGKQLLRWRIMCPRGSCCWRRSHTRWCTSRTSLVSNNLGTNHADSPQKISCIVPGSLCNCIDCFFKLFWRLQMRA